MLESFLSCEHCIKACELTSRPATETSSARAATGHTHARRHALHRHAPRVRERVAGCHAHRRKRGAQASIVTGSDGPSLWMTRPGSNERSASSHQGPLLTLDSTVQRVRPVGLPVGAPLLTPLPRCVSILWQVSKFEGDHFISITKIS